MTAKETFIHQVSEETYAIAAVVGILTLISPTVGACGLLSWCVGLAFIRIMNVEALKSLPVHTHVNLVSTGMLLGLSLTSMEAVKYVGCAAIATVLLTGMVSRLFYYYLIPVMLIPSLLVTWAALGFHADHAAAASLSTESFPWAAGILGFFVLLRSPIFLIMTLCGMVTALLLQTIFIPVNPHHSFFSVVIAGFAFAACASVMSMPSRRSLAWSLVGLVLFYAFLAPLAHAFKLPSSVLVTVTCLNIAVTLSLYSSRISNRMTTFWSYRFLPEQKLDEAITLWSRFRTGEARTGLPFTGIWNVSQSFDGPWTHRGNWRHGLDFVMSDHAGKTHKDSGYELTDYYAYGKEIVAPSSGYIVALSSHFPDNKIGSVDNVHNFGNYVIIRDVYGAHAVVAHLMMDSITCKLYQYIEAGTVIGRCGNSGYSPEPHIHLHVQADPLIGSATIPFHLTNYLVSNQFKFHGVPAVGEVIRRPQINVNLARQLSFEVGETFEITSRNAINSERNVIENRLDPQLGVMYFSDGASKLFHYRDQFTFYFYRYEGKKSGALFDLMTALPRVPFLFGVNCHYSDQMPVTQWKSIAARVTAYLRQIFLANFHADDSTFHLKNDTLEVINSGSGMNEQLQTMCLLDAIDGFATFTVGERQYEVTVRRKMADAHHFTSNPAGSRGGENEVARIAI